MVDRDEMRAIMAVIFRAIEEQQRDGRVTTARCEVCGALLAVDDRVTAWVTSCKCGRYNETLRGL